jgi:hypothetical protein
MLAMISRLAGYSAAILILLWFGMGGLTLLAVAGLIGVAIVQGKECQEDAAEVKAVRRIYS